MKYCTKCGSPIGDERFCTNCGAPAPAVPAPDAQPKKSNAAVIILAAALAVLIAVIVLICVTLFGGKTGGANHKGYKDYEDLVEAYVEAIEDRDAEIIFGLVPQEIVDAEIDENKSYKDEDDFIDKIQDELDDYTDDIKDKTGKNMKISYKIKSVETYSSREVEDFQDELDRSFDDCDVTIKEAKDVEVKITASGSDGRTSIYDTLFLVKIGNKWYLIESNIDII